MVTVIIGKQEEFNSYHLSDILDNYIPILHLFRENMNKIKWWAQSLQPPIMGNKYILTVFEDKVNIRDFKSTLKVLETLENHNYLDIVWVITEVRGNVEDTITTCKIIELSKSRRQDMISFIKKDLEIPDNNIDVIKSICSKVKWSFSVYSNYRTVLKDHKHNLTLYRVGQIIKSDITESPERILYGILNRDKKMIKEYYILCRKYSTSWVTDYFISSLQNVITAKEKYLITHEFRLSDISQKKKYKNLRPIITQIPIGRVYVLLILLCQGYGIEKYISLPNTSNDYIKYLH